MQDKSAEVEGVCRTAAALAESGEDEAVAARDRAQSLRQQWHLLHKTVEQRIHLALSYCAFHKKAQQLAIQMDALEQYLKIEKMDPSQITEQSIKHKESKYGEMSSQFGEVESKGKQFIKEASEVSGT